LLCFALLEKKGASLSLPSQFAMSAFMLSAEEWSFGQSIAWYWYPKHQIYKPCKCQNIEKS
jgi:hypothetical protein